MLVASALNLTGAASILQPLLGHNDGLHLLPQSVVEAPALRAALALARALRWSQMALVAETRAEAEAFGRLSAGDASICVIDEVIVTEIGE